VEKINILYGEYNALMLQFIHHYLGDDSGVDIAIENYP